MNLVAELFEEFRRKRSELEVSVDQMKEDIAPFTGKILLYGAGSSGIAFLYQLRRTGVEPVYFVDANEKKKGISIEGLPVLAPEDVVETVGMDCLIIVCINTDGKRYCKSFAEALRIGGHHGVYDRLHQCGCKNVVDYTYFRRCYALFREEKYNAPSCSDVDLMLEHQADIEAVYEMLSDDLSREVYGKILRFRLLDDSIEVPTMTQEKQYFEYGFYERRPDEVFVDCGAFNGISLRTFLKENKNQFSGYYGFEPDEVNFKALQEYIVTLPQEQQDKVRIWKAGTWNNDKGTTLYSLEGPGSFVADIGNIPIETVTIDDALKGQSASYIKMNIEGSEIQSLEGARHTIETYQPRLAIAGYHKTWDLWEIPLLIKSYHPGYQLYLRSYMNHISFVYYAV